MTVEQIKTRQHHATGKWVAECYSRRVGQMTQWGSTEEEAIKQLINFVEVQGDQWPPIAVAGDPGLLEIKEALEAALELNYNPQRDSEDKENWETTMNKIRSALARPALAGME